MTPQSDCTPPDHGLESMAASRRENPDDHPAIDPGGRQRGEAPARDAGALPQRPPIAAAPELRALIPDVDALFSRVLGEDVRRGLREAASRGFWVRSRAPYGYEKARIKEGARKRVLLVIDPAASQVVRHIFDMARLAGAPQTSPPH